MAHGIIVEEEKGLRPWTTRSLTLIATRSMPTVSCLPAAMAIFSLVPTPVGGGDQVGVR
jgi:xanthine/uracil permease